MADQTDAVKETIEQWGFANQEAFKEGFEKSMAAFGDFNNLGKENLEAVIASFTATGKGLEAVTSNLTNYSKQAMEDSVAAAKALASAKSFQEIVELQSEYTKSAMDAYLGEVKKMSDLMSATMKDSVAPINDRFTSVIEFMQTQR
ncbi:MAG: phasin family protein [Maricaulaceae bacterium]